MSESNQTFAPNRSNRKVGRLSLLVLLAVLALLVAGLAVAYPAWQRAGDRLSNFDIKSVPTPASLEELVRCLPGPPCDLILVARVDSIQEVGWLPTLTPPPEFPDDPGHEPWPYTNYSLLPERVLLDNGTIRSGQPVLVGQDGHPDDQSWSDFPHEKPGERYLYFLDRYDFDPRNVYTSAHSKYSRLIIDGDVVMYSGNPPEPVPFATGTPPAAFIEAVATAVATLYPTPSP